MSTEPDESDPPAPDAPTASARVTPITRLPRAQSREHAALLLRTVYFQVSPTARQALDRIAKRAGVTLTGRQPGNSPDPLLSLDSAMRYLRACGVNTQGKPCGTDAGTRALHDADAAVVRLELARLARTKPTSP